MYEVERDLLDLGQVRGRPTGGNRVDSPAELRGNLGESRVSVQTGQRVPRGVSEPPPVPRFLERPEVRRDVRRLDDERHRLLERERVIERRERTPEPRALGLHLGRN